MNYIEKQEQTIKEALNSLGFESEKVSLIPSLRPDLGEYQFNGIMAIAKKYQENPQNIAKKLVDILKEKEEYESVSIAGPGFINFTFQNNSLLKYAEELLNKKQFVNPNSQKKIIIDYGGPNVAKVLHVGHLRSAIIGESLKRLAKLFGYEVIADVHLGDYGLQMGMIMCEIKNRYPNLSCFQKGFQEKLVTDLPITNEDLIDLYPIASQKAKNDEKIMEEARHITYLLQQNDPSYKALWNTILEISLKDIKDIYQKLNVEFDLWNGESDAEKVIPEMIEYLHQKNMTRESEGAEIIEVAEETDKLPIPPLLLIKTNKTVSYETTDLATLWERNKEKADEIWYVVDKRQELHFTQVFRAAKKTEIIDNKTKLEFIGFGTMNGKDGKPFKTRAGGVMSLRNLLNLVTEETKKKMIPSITGEERENLASTIAIGTIKFADLLSHRATDYIFDPEKFSDANGKTGPFIMYSTIRMRSLLEKAKEINIEKYEFKSLKGTSDKKILLQILNLQKVLENALEEKSLHEITNYLYNLNNTYNNFYSENRILTEENKDLRDSWLALTKLTYEINELLLNILSIEIPVRM